MCLCDHVLFEVCRGFHTLIVRIAEQVRFQRCMSAKCCLRHSRVACTSHVPSRTMPLQAAAAATHALQPEQWQAALQAVGLRVQSAPLRACGCDGSTVSPLLDSIHGVFASITMHSFQCTNDTALHLQPHGRTNTLTKLKHMSC